MSTVEPALLRVQRDFEASPAEVFNAWTNPEVLRRWWGIEADGLVPVAEIDLRVGGRWRMGIQAASGGPLRCVQGEYREVRPPELLVYTWAWEDENGVPESPSTVTARFEGSENLTTVVIEHAGLATEEARERHKAGWEASLAKLQGRGLTPG